MEFRILGPLLVVANGGQPRPFGPRQTKVLATLLLATNRAVPIHDLIDAVWDDDPPPTARRQIQNCVWTLRKQLTVRADGPGYRIPVDHGQLDAQQFQDLVTEARASAATGKLGPAVDQMTAALRLWRGPALAGCTGRTIQASAARLNEQRLTVIEQRLDLELTLGRHRELVGELIELAAAHPLRERLIGQLMLALHASGRQADALAVYQQLQARLVDELGIGPGADLRQLHTAILRDEVDVRRTVAVAAPRPPTPIAPAQLPTDVPSFAGRTDQLTRLHGIAAVTDRPTAVVISAIAGTAGVGKTALAVHWAHQVANQFPHGQLYVNLRGFDPAGTVMDPAEAIRRFLDALGVPPQRIPADPDAQVGLYRTLLAGKRVLIVLDNARDPDQVGPLLPGSPGCLVLVTSRNRLSGLVATVGAHPVPLDLLTLDEARDLIARRIGIRRVAAEPDAVDEIITCCARLPLALAIAAANAATQPQRSLTAIAADLHDAQDRLGFLSTGDTPTTDLRAVFSWSYRTLTPDTARLFRLLGLHPGPDIAAPAAASAAALPLDRARTLLAELARTNLLTEHARGRYTFHDLLRAYAADLSRTTDPDRRRRAAVHRVLDHYLHTAYAAERLLYPARDPISLTPPRPGVISEAPADHERAFEWFTAECPALLAAVEHAAATGFDSHTWRLAWALDTFLDRRGHWHDQAATGRAAAAAAGRLADPTAQAGAHRLLARAYRRLGRFDDAHTLLRQALDLYDRAGDRIGQAHTHVGLAVVWGRQGCRTEALDHARRALKLYRVADHQRGQALALNAIGWNHALLGEHQQTLTCCQQALTLFQELGDRSMQAAAWDSLGYAHHHLGQHTEAITCYQHTIELYRSLGDRYEEATTLTNLGETHHITSNTEAARTAWQQALTILDQLDHPDADTVRAKLHHLDP
ncbi:AfsR/SARP family transcriptional regulator [Virgisporangium aurantiacum]|uniref:SARP family transcriptional regulator n=1 Tax=Virgisporangium aurantiacum TaxID=175570 RepID=A0A8J4E6E2_9ACTN|nr:BTAD domain-containing putative transcriptional regulator [Virgisporangium aurantiacum]GIJ63985.1 SARP family transcriptional regulator [Virgisporangium aurantiacum]